jgi:putative transposase
VLSKLAYLTPRRSIQALVLLARGDAAKDLELLMLRHQLAVLRRQVCRAPTGPCSPPSVACCRGAGWSCFLVTPETLLRWHRRLVAGVRTSPTADLADLSSTKTPTPLPRLRVAGGRRVASRSD